MFARLSQHWLPALLLVLAAAAPGAGQTLQSPPGVRQPDDPGVRMVARWMSAAESAAEPADTRPVPEVPPQEAPYQTVPAPAPVEAEPIPTGPPAETGLTLADLERIALGHNPTITQAAMRVQANEARFVQAGLYPNPTVGYVGVDMGIEGTAGQQGVSVGQEIITARKLRKGQAVADRQAEQARYALEAQEYRVLNDVRSGYYDVLVARRTVDLYEELVRIGELGHRTAEQLHAAMEVSRLDVLQARIEADSVKLRLYEARNTERATWRQLVALLGVPRMEPAPLAGRLEDDLPQLTWEDSLRYLLSNSPLLAEAQISAQRFEAAIIHQRSLWKPNIDLAVGFTYANDAQDNLTHAEVNLEVPIFNRNQGNIWKAQAGLMAARKEIQRMRLQLRDRLAAAFQHYDNARHEVGVYSKDLLPTAKKSLELVRAGYRQGEFDYLKLLTSQRTFFEVNLAYVESLHKLRSSSVSIEGMLLSGGLESPMFDEVMTDEFIVGD